jgi:hypothetical protein
MSIEIDTSTLTATSIVGGSAGGILSTSVNIVSLPLSFFGLPDLTMILNTIVLAFIGATVGLSDVFFLIFVNHFHLILNLWSRFWSH